MACLSSSPPPLMPEDEEEEEDSSFADNYDLSESDNTLYDLTGLSEKLHSIPKDAIHATPKEISQNFQPTEGGIQFDSNGVPQCPGIDVEDLDDDISELDRDDLKTETSHNLFPPDALDPDISSLDCKSLDLPDPDYAVTGDLQSEPLNVNEAYPVGDEDTKPREDANDLPVDAVSVEEDLPHEMNSQMHIKGLENIYPIEEHSQFEELVSCDVSNNSNSVLPSEVPQVSELAPEQSDQNLTSSNSQEIENDFGDFADFESNPWSQAEPQPQVIPQSVCRTEEAPLHLEDDDDDDFGEFDSAEFVSATAPLPTPISTVLSALHPKITTVISDLFGVCPEAGCDQFSSPKALNPTDEDEVWLKVEHIETTPALGLAWNKSVTHSCVMKILKMDPRNIIIEPKPKKFSTGSVPAFASTVSSAGVLHPTKIEKVDERKNAPIRENETFNAGQVPPVEFDWQKSGLKNPLEQNAGPLKPSPLSDATNSAAPSVEKSRSREAAAILESFPLLNFMQSPVLLRPDEGQK